MSRNKEFAVNTFILFLGKFSTQLVSFLCLPIYTRYLLTEDYGLIDLYITLISLLIPFVNIRLDVVAFRFLSDYRNNNEKKKSCINNIFSLLFVSVIISTILCIIVSFFLNIKYFWLALLNLIISSISVVVLQMLRGLNKNKNYSIACAISSLTLLLSTVIFIIILHMDAKSILLASSISNFLCICYCFYIIRPNIVNLKNAKNQETKSMISYAVPMIVDASSWWIVNVSDRGIITYFIGVAYNGIYSISCKFSNILNSVFLVFNMSWQEAIISHKNDEDGEKYISKLGNGIISLFLTISILMISIIPIFYDLIIGNAYLSSKNYIPVLLLGNIFSVISTLVGSILVVYKQTKTIARTTFVAAIINIVINILFVKKFGLYAAAISTLISYFVIGIYRYIKCKFYLNFKINFRQMFIFLTVYVFSSILFYLNNYYLNIINFVFVLLFSYTYNKKIINSQVKKIYGKLKTLK